MYISICLLFPRYFTVNEFLVFFIPNAEVLRQGVRCGIEFIQIYAHIAVFRFSDLKVLCIFQCKKRMHQSDFSINTRVRLSGLTKQEYIVCRLQERDVIVQPNSRLFKAMRDGIREILSELKRIEKSSDVTNEMLDTINLLAKTYHDLEEK